MQPFTVPNDPKVLETIRSKIAAYDWEIMRDFGQKDKPWAGGMDQSYLREFCDYWLLEYQWADSLAELNQFPHFMTEIEGLDIHFIMEEGSGSNPPAVLMTHGWPGSVYEFMQVIPRLAHPENYGGTEEDGVTVICPSLPGYGWSGKPKHPIGPKETAKMWNTLMVDILGYDTYIAQGGDWGSLVTGYLGTDFGTDKGGACRAIHLNMYGLAVAEEPSTPEELSWLENFKLVMAAETGYLHVQATKPLTLAYAMMDSPVGVAAWLLEKFNAWSDLRPRPNKPAQSPSPHLENVYTKHQLLTNIMIYLTTHSFNAASWYYLAYFTSKTGMQAGDNVGIPTAMANYAQELICFPPRSLVEKGYRHITQWTDYDKIGHFAAFEDPETFSADVQKFLKTL